MVGELTIALSHLLAEGAVTIDTEVEALVGNVDVQTKGIVGIRITNHRLIGIILINLTIAVVINELHVTRL